jgi:hypothetical protein
VVAKRLLKEDLKGDNSADMAKEIVKENRVKVSRVRVRQPWSDSVQDASGGDM